MAQEEADTAGRASGDSGSGCAGLKGGSAHSSSAEAGVKAEGMANGAPGVVADSDCSVAQEAAAAGAAGGAPASAGEGGSGGIQPQPAMEGKGAGKAAGAVEAEDEEQDREDQEWGRRRQAAATEACLGAMLLRLFQVGRGRGFHWHRPSCCCIPLSMRDEPAVHASVRLPAAAARPLPLWSLSLADLCTVPGASPLLPSPSPAPPFLPSLFRPSPSRLM